MGTPLYVAPEMLYESASGPFTDLWALGVIIYEIVCGSSPWRGTTDLEKFNNIKEGNIVYPRQMNKLAVDLVEKLIVLDPLQRLGVGEPGTPLDFASFKSH